MSLRRLHKDTEKSKDMTVIKESQQPGGDTEMKT